MKQLEKRPISSLDDKMFYIVFDGIGYFVADGESVKEEKEMLDEEPVEGLSLSVVWESPIAKECYRMCDDFNS